MHVWALLSKPSLPAGKEVGDGVVAGAGHREAWKSPQCPEVLRLSWRLQSLLVPRGSREGTPLDMKARAAGRRDLEANSCCRPGRAGAGAGAGTGTGRV